jgi:hypothetical protein
MNKLKGQHIQKTFMSGTKQIQIKLTGTRYLWIWTEHCLQKEQIIRRIPNLKQQMRTQKASDPVTDQNQYNKNRKKGGDLKRKL